MKKLIIFLLYIFLFNVIGINFIEASELTTSKINARILPSVWYSTLSINDGESIKIYSAIQNNSNIDFNGNATFYVDEENISNVSFVSNKDTLKDISTNWVAVPGIHTIKVKISASLPPSQELVSYESDASTITIIEKVIEQEKIINIDSETLENIKDTISDVISKVDEVAIPI